MKITQLSHFFGEKISSWVNTNIQHFEYKIKF